MHGRSRELTAVVTAMEHFDHLSHKVPPMTGPAGVDNDEIASVPLQGSYTSTYFDQVCSTDETNVKLSHLGLQDLLSTKSWWQANPLSALLAAETSFPSRLHHAAISTFNFPNQSRESEDPAVATSCSKTSICVRIVPRGYPFTSIVAPALDP